MEKGYEFVSGKNGFNKESFEKMCKILEQGKGITVGTNVIGHGLNNCIQEEYKNKLIEKYNDNLIVKHSNGCYSYSYSYILKK